MDSTINLSADTSDKIEQKYAFKDFFFFFFSPIIQWPLLLRSLLKKIGLIICISWKSIFKKKNTLELPTYDT